MPKVTARVVMLAAQLRKNKNRPRGIREFDPPLGHRYAGAAKGRPSDAAATRRHVASF